MVKPRTTPILNHFFFFFSQFDLLTLVIYLFYCKPKLASYKLPCNSEICNCILD